MAICYNKLWKILIDVIQSHLNALPLLFFVQLADRTFIITKGVFSCLSP